VHAWARPQAVPKAGEMWGLGAARRCVGKVLPSAAKRELLLAAASADTKLRLLNTLNRILEHWWVQNVRRVMSALDALS
jgi:hypothetical protein